MYNQAAKGGNKKQGHFHDVNKQHIELNQNHIHDHQLIIFHQNEKFHVMEYKLYAQFHQFPSQEKGILNLYSYYPDTLFYYASK